MPDLHLPGPAGRLQASYWPAKAGEGARAAVAVCHPHPLYGGTMDNTVVFRTARALQVAGLAVLRFNFRGVGGSEGEHHGQGGEAEDLGAALDWLERELPGVDPRIARVVLVALPVRAFDCSFLRDVRQPGLIVMAENDEYGTLAELRRQFPDLHAGLELDEVPGTGHFFEGATRELERRVQAWARRAQEARR